MRRCSALLLAVAVACAKKESAPDTTAAAAPVPPPTSGPQLVGTWNGRAYASDKDTGAMYVYHRPAGDLKTTPAHLIFGKDTVEINVVSFTDSSWVEETKPYKNMKGVEVTGHAEGRFVTPDSAVGTAVETPTKGGAKNNLRYVVWKVGPP